MDFIDPMLAAAVDYLPTGDDMLYEPKWDGFRAVSASGDPARIWSKAGRPLHPRWPEIADAITATVADGALLDGEIVRWSQDGYLDFSALLQRHQATMRRARSMARREPCHYIVFDALAIEGRDISHRALSYRRARLEELMSQVASPSPLTLGWQTDQPQAAMQWWETLPAVGVEGVMIKNGRRSYRPGRREWRKYKVRATTEAIVGGIIGNHTHPKALILGRFDPDTGHLRPVGRTTDLTYAQSDELAEVIHKAGSDHPWPTTLSTRSGDRTRQIYTRVEPEVVVEVAPDTATTDQGWRHLVQYKRYRADLRPSDVPLGLDMET